MQKSVLFILYMLILSVSLASLFIIVLCDINYESYCEWEDGNTNIVSEDNGLIEADIDGYNCSNQWHMSVQPHPANGATNVPTNTLLSWKSCEHRAKYSIWFGTEYPLVEIGTRISTSNRTEFAPGPLKPNTKYYWRIDYRFGKEGAWIGTQWFFTTGE